MQIVVNSLLTHYEKTGSGKQHILLLHGWGDSLETFKAIQKDLAKKYTVISVDLPGFGGSQPPNDVWGLDDYVAFVKDTLAKLGVKHLYAIVAHSNGGALAIRGTANSTLSVDKLILLASAGIRDKQKGKRLMLKVIAKTGKTVTFWLPAHHKKKLQKKLYGAAGSDMLAVPHLQETFKRTVQQDVQADAAKLGLPTLLIYGEQDTATPPLYGEIFHNLINGSTLEIVGGAGHFIHLEEPVKVQKLIEEFLV